MDGRVDLVLDGGLVTGSRRDYGGYHGALLEGNQGGRESEKKNTRLRPQRGVAPRRLRGFTGLHSRARFVRYETIEFRPRVVRTSVSCSELDTQRRQEEAETTQRV